MACLQSHSFFSIIEKKKEKREERREGWREGEGKREERREGRTKTEVLVSQPRRFHTVVSYIE